jgi:hypothetical protein
MTVASTQNRKTFAGDDATTSFATTPIVFFATSDLQVYVTTDATGASTLLTEGVGYTVSGGDASAGAVGTVDTSGGSVPHGALLSGTTLVILRELPLTQGANFVNNDASDADVAEAALDKLVMNVQRLSERVDRAFVLPDGDVSGASTELPTPVASQLIGWNADADELALYSAASLTATIVPTAYAETLLAEADGDNFFQNIVDSATAETAPAIGDFVMLSDVSLTPDSGVKMTLANVLKVVNGLTADATPDRAADYLLTYDADAAAAKKVLLSVAVPASSDTVAGQIEIATQAEQETGTDATRAVTPGRQHFHPSAVKGWVKANIDGTIDGSYNVTSVTDAGTGSIAVNWATDFGDTNYCVLNAVKVDLGGAAATTWIATISNTGFTAGVTAAVMVRASDGGAVVDPNEWMFVALGDFA